MSLSHVGILPGVSKEFDGFSYGDFVLLFNQNKLSVDEALKIVSSGEYSPYVLLISQSQWSGLFLNEDAHLTLS